MRKIEILPSHSDHRGIISDILENVNLNAITRITFTEGAVRANHYHKATTQWNYVIKGKILIRTQMLGSSEAPEDIIMSAGDFVETVPYELHALKALTDAELLVFTQGPRGGKEYESDTFRLEAKLIDG